MEEVEQEKELVFKRFPEEKQEQVRQLVSYCTLMGLTGKDLVSIGGKLARIDERREIQNLIQIAQDYEASTKPIGKNKADQERNEGQRWTYTDSTGAKWDFTTQSFWSISIRSRTTGKIRNFYTMPHIRYGSRRGLKNKVWMYNALIALHLGEIVLNF